ncbi:hypothetical protein MGYG_07015 [Nannizzia gypsea CBS 118893]|uniref:Aminoglycoside phosphotransferase domain-containing protein n=1 Tax=Arthroderma gypseum (strain ATCC MYA-4604 / CBS 118893) TaxID=535722 RepID=E4V1U5_ARTGP|nr:hypothetical protein MGYG_07015 [Nannizzia gypsea CBS 118893]EFR04010.1 hypothetical protein MGYG_07015 [Nannizzia gypsea CBS 118893]
MLPGNRAFKRKASSPDVLAAVTEFMVAKYPSSRPIDRARIIGVGAFNFCYRMEFNDGFASLLRFASPGRSLFPEEKTEAEVAVMRFIKENTRIPVPTILDWGMQGPCDMGPYILMEFISSSSNLTAKLRKPGFAREDRPILDPNIDESKLELLYGQMADIMLQLSRCSHSKIGCLSAESDGQTITKRPLTMNMNELVQLGGYPRADLPSSPFISTSDHFYSLAKTHYTHLSTQRNDAIQSEEDCRNKYTIRKILLKLAGQSKFTHEDALDRREFRLFCDDLRPTNVLIDENFKVVAVIDWEFTYAAPSEFTYSPPWWLLLETPEDWPSGILDWAKTYDSRLKIFLRAMACHEDIAIQEGRLSDGERLSERMSDSWKSGDFWVYYGLRKSWALDIVWPFIDQAIYGGEQTHEQRVALLADRIKFTDNERKEMDAFVQQKLRQSEPGAQSNVPGT